MSYKSSSLNKTLVFALGFFFCFLIFELSLQISAMLISTKKISTLPASMKEFRVLCLGESTTAPWIGTSGEDISYPAQLQEILTREARHKKFKIINAAVSGSNSAQILSKLDETIKKSQPQLVTAQIGINDWGDTIPYQDDFLTRLLLSIQNLKTYKFIRNMFGNYNLLTPDHISNFSPYRIIKDTIIFRKLLFFFSSARSNTLPKQTPLELDIQKGTELIWSGNTDEAIAFHKKLIKKHPTESRVFHNLSQIYERIHEKKEALNYLLKAAQIKKTDQELWNQVGYLYTEEKMFNRAALIFNKVLAQNPQNISANNGLVYIQMKKNNYKQAEKIIKSWQRKMPTNHEAHLRLCRLYEIQMLWEKMIPACSTATMHVPSTIVDSHFKLALAYTKLEKWIEAEEVIQSLLRQKKDPRYFYELAQISILQKKFKKAAEYQEEARQIELRQYPLGMRTNLKLIVKKIEITHIPLAIIQYATRDASIIKKMLEPLNQFDVIESNKDFYRAFQTHSYDELFIDNFAGDFGHATKLGNSILARNMANYILIKFDLPN